jgi:uncharacterized protein involved in type VI secretion and phage assembly
MEAVQRTFGLLIGTVTDTDDPQGEGRVRVRIPQLGEGNELYWAPVMSPFAGKDRGFWSMPEVEDEAVIAFERGDPQFPIVVGFLWNTKSKPPSTVTNERMWRSVNGHTIRFLDPDPKDGDLGAVVVEDAQGNKVTLSNGKVTVRSVAVLEIDAPTIILKGPGYHRVVAPNSNPI